MGRVAAIFDLDRTVLRGASGPFLNRALEEVGLRERRLPGEDALYRIFDLLGENLLGIALARIAALAVRGWRVEEVRHAGERAADLLGEEVAAYAPVLLEEHRLAGHLLVLASTSPAELISPIAKRLGIDEVVATRYATCGDRYSGRLDGGFVWSAGKLAAVRELSRSLDVSLEESYAYSDSVFDLPLLSAVAHPHAVNPDLGLLAAAVLRRWPVLHLDVPPGTPSLFGIEACDVVRLAARRELFPYARFAIEGAENIPARGPFILVCDHHNHFDLVTLAIVLNDRGRTARFVVGEEVFDEPIVGRIASWTVGISAGTRGGVRGGPSATVTAAERVLRAGEGLVIFGPGPAAPEDAPEGRSESAPESGTADLAGRESPEVARLLEATGAPILQASIVGTEAVWPRAAVMPKLWRMLDPAKVRVSIGRPVIRQGPSRRRATAPGSLAATRSREVAATASDSRLPRGQRKARAATTAPQN